MVEHRLPKPGVAGSIPVSRSNVFSLIRPTTGAAFAEGPMRNLGLPYAPHKRASRVRISIFLNRGKAKPIGDNWCFTNCRWINAITKADAA
jgi:hypothetical protein